MLKCNKCGYILKSNNYFCPLCSNLLKITNNQVSISAYELTKIPWESVQYFGFLKSLFLTVKNVLFNPHVFFSKVSNSTNSFYAFIYAIIIGIIGNLFGFLWSYIFFIFGIDSDINRIPSFSYPEKYMAIALILLPCVVAIKQLFLSLYFHLLIVIFNPSKIKKIKYTFISICYTESAAVFNIIPFIGNIIYIFFYIYVLTTAFAKVHKISSFNSLLIIFLPLLIIVFIFIIILAISLSTGLILKDIFKGFF